MDQPQAEFGYVPILIRRPGDANWRYWTPQVGPDCPYGLVTNEKGKATFDLLCAGDYEVRSHRLMSLNLPRAWRKIRMNQHRTIKLMGTR